MIAEFVTRTTAFVAEFIMRTTALTAEVLSYVAFVPGVSNTRIVVGGNRRVTVDSNVRVVV